MNRIRARKVADRIISLQPISDYSPQKRGITKFSKRPWNPHPTGNRPTTAAGHPSWQADHAVTGSPIPDVNSSRPGPGTGPGETQRGFCSAPPSPKFTVVVVVVVVIRRQKVKIHFIHLLTYLLNVSDSAIGRHYTLQICIYLLTESISDEASTFIKHNELETSLTDDRSEPNNELEVRVRRQMLSCCSLRQREELAEVFTVYTSALLLLADVFK